MQGLVGGLGDDIWRRRKRRQVQPGIAPSGFGGLGALAAGLGFPGASLFGFSQAPAQGFVQNVAPLIKNNLFGPSKVGGGGHGLTMHTV